MAKITIAGDAVVVTSAIKLEDLKTIKKYRPEALTLKGGEDNKEEIFKVSVTDGDGSINNFGATFGSATRDDAKLATFTMVINGLGEGADIKDVVADKIGSSIINLNKLEASLPAVIDEIAAEKASVLERITVAQ